MTALDDMYMGFRDRIDLEPPRWHQLRLGHGRVSHPGDGEHICEHIHGVSNVAVWKCVVGVLGWAERGCYLPFMLRFVLLFVTLAACGGGDGTFDPPSDAGVRDATETDAGDVDVYATDHLMRVQISMPSASWDALRRQTRDWREVLGGEDCLDAPFGSPFTWFEAEVTIDGANFARVDVRKKGFLGSLSESKPSLKFDLGEFVDGQTYGGLRRLTLNNAREDPSLLRQCLGYLVFERAGVPAPRCSFAQVEVNGEDLGVYVNVEPINSAFIRRVFGSDEGNLYEGTLSDFRSEMLRTFEPKNNGEELGRQELADLAEALQAEDDELLEALAPFVDVDAFLTFWAMESLLDNDDGYSQFRNNFYIYRDPATGQFRFIPWGIDLILVEDGPPVFARGTVAYRLYQLPETQDRYFQRLDALLVDAWDEDVLVAELARMQSLIEPALGGRRTSVAEAIETLRETVMRRRDVITQRLATGRPHFGSYPSPFQCLPAP